jgi:hypothetical protein
MSPWRQVRQSRAVTSEAHEIQVVVNWFAELKVRLPAK